ncbi:MAG: hypothetical protein ACRCVY_04950 [Commensalibacter sp.]
MDLLKVTWKRPGCGACANGICNISRYLENFLSNPKRAVIAARLRNMDRTFIADNNGFSKADAMIGDLFFASVMCRVFSIYAFPRHCQRKTMPKVWRIITSGITTQPPEKLLLMKTSADSIKRLRLN